MLEGVTYGGHWNAAAQTLSGTDLFPRPDGPKLIFMEAMHDEILPNFISLERMRVLGLLEGAAIVHRGPFWQKPGQAVRQWLIDYCDRWQIPLVVCLRFGHFHPISVLPVGAMARLDTRSFRLGW